ncbi:MAG: hypothetical protein ACO1NX_05640 [Chitinophagaceae bacterium]
MFLAVKNPLQLEVTLRGEKVMVKPVTKSEAEKLVYRTLARCEEFLAQVFLQVKASFVSYEKHKSFFWQRGWQVVEG